MQDLGKKVIYQIYPKSFYDSNGDGIGDLRGIIEKLDYIEKLNVDMIWFNPFFVSLQNDNGYDISDHYQIDPLFGTMEDFEELQSKLEKLGIDVMLDMVLNHCSTEHEWFKKALAGDKEHQKYFYLRPTKEDGSLPTNWFQSLAALPGKDSATLSFIICIYMTKRRQILTGTTKKQETSW